ncbi:MAG: DUF2341 domain-containing protein, partial [Dehalococcoidales bacterium]|nr:DUF2341 domain-containing protein [Dehalococcoidales bacterium]
DFGDSQTSTEKNPAHTYLTTGSYTVNLTVSNDLGSNSSVQTGYITVGTGIPVGNFTANVTSSTAPPLTVQFTDTTTVNPTAWHWDFGDGVTSSERNPDHTYATAGIYTVNLTVLNSYGSNSCVKTDYITVGSGISVGAFTANTTSGNAPLAVQFTDGSTLNPASWYWDFGDNVTSTEQNPVHVYTADGSYTVNLTVSNSYGSNSCVKTGYITVGSGIPVGAFTVNTTSGNAPLTVQFTDGSTINPTAWSWNFGDNATSTEQNPVHTYAANGNYTVNLTISNSYGSNSCVKIDYITVGSGIPVGAFTANATSGNAPLAVQFTDGSTINPTAWSWDFGDGATSTEQNPVHTYAANGNYTVNLTVSNSYGSNSCVKTDYITVGSGIPVGAFTANTTSGNAPLTVQFTDTSTINPTAWSWDFGDGATSTEQNPVHTYAANGNYTVNITVSNSYGSNSCVKTDYITVGSGIPVGAFIANTTSGNAPLTVQFIDTSTINPIAWSWDFGDGATSTEQNPVHTYAANGNYTVNFTISNIYGSNSCVKTEYITVGSGIPVASFTADVSNGFLPFMVRFTDTSAVNPTAWAWDFGDGATSNEQNPVHTYTNVGNYTVNLTVSNSYGTNTLTKDGYIHTGRYAFSQNITYTAGDQNVIQQEVIIHRTTGSPYEENRADGTKVWHVQVGDLCRADYGDVRFADTTGTPLAYYLWSHYTAEQGRFFVRLEKAYQPGTLQVLYGDSGVLSASNADAIGAYLIDEFNTLNSTWSGGAIENGQLTYISTGALTYIYGVTRPITPIPAEFSMETDLSYEPYGYSDGDVMLEVYTADSYARIGYYQPTWGGASFATVINGLQMPCLGDGTVPEPGAMNLKITRDASNKISAYKNGTLMGTGTMGGSITRIGFRVNDINNGAGGHTSHWDNLAIRSFSTTPPAASDLKPVGSFSANSTSGDAPLTVRFTASSFNSPTTWAWDFGDGATSTDQNPVHTYSAGGNYTVNLTLSNSYGSNSFVKTDYITLGSGIPVGNFTTTWTNGYAPLRIQFIDTSTINPTAWAWDFGDGATSTSQNPVHSYSAAGNYTVSLNATNGYGSNTITKSGYIYAGSAGYSQNFSFTASDQAMYQQEVVIHRADGTNYEEITNGWRLWHVYVGDRCREDYSDLRYTDATGIQLVYYLLPDYNTNQARFYVRLERADQPGTLQILYGNSGVPSASNADATGCVVDLFTTLNPNWDTSGVSSATIDNGQLKLTAKTGTQGKSSTAAVKRSITPITGGFVADVDLTYVSSYPSSPSRSRGELYLILYNSSSTMAAGYFDSWSSTSATYNGSFFYAIGGTSANTGRGTRPAVGGMHLTITRDAANSVSVYENGILRATKIMPGAISSIGLSNTRYGTDSYYYNTYWDNLVVHSFSTTPPGAYGFQPVGNFTANKLSGSAPLTVQFNDTSRYYPTSWAWDFGDGTTSVEQSPVHTYAADGNYTVNLTVTNSYGSNSLVKIGYITVGSGIPVASFTADVTNGYSPVTVQFTDTSTINPTSWAWDFGDGTTSIEQNPVHTYSTYGTNTVTLTATNGYGSNTITKAGYILSGKNAYSQKIDFSAGELSLYLQVVVIHRTTGAAYEDNATGMKVWHLYAGGHCREDYGDVRFTDANGFPVKYYLQPGYTAEQARFSIRLEGADHPGALKVLYGEPGVTTTSDVSITNITVNATASLPSATIFSGEGYTDAAPAASFTGTPVYGLSHTIRFTDTSANYPTTWSWDFGDGTTSTLQNPVHTFAADGNYTVTLSATNEYGSDTETIRDYTVEMPVVASVTVSPTSFQLNVSETRQFTAVLLDQKGNSMTNTSVTWSSSDETVGTVDTKGLFTARH